MELTILLTQHHYDHIMRHWGEELNKATGGNWLKAHYRIFGDSCAWCEALTARWEVEGVGRSERTDCTQCPLGTFGPGCKRGVSAWGKLAEFMGPREKPQYADFAFSRLCGTLFSTENYPATLADRRRMLVYRIKVMIVAIRRAWRRYKVKMAKPINSLKSLLRTGGDPLVAE